LNYHEILPSRWSPDGSLLLWEVDGKWFSDALLLLRLENGKVAWQRNLLRLRAGRAILARTKQGGTGKVCCSQKANAGNGIAYPDGFQSALTQPRSFLFHYECGAYLTSDPKATGQIPKLESHLDAIIDTQGKFTVTDF
jgi:hypothetical protein